MLRFIVASLVVLWGLAGVATAQSWHEPARGTAERADLMDAIRPHAEYALGIPVKFRVDVLRVAVDRAFAILQPLDQAGREVPIAGTPMLRRSGESPDVYDGSRIDTLYVKSGRVWVALHWEIGATDAWYANPALCPEFGAVLPDFCF